jgi:hypothetical protein
VTSMSYSEVFLPRGVRESGGWCRRVSLRPLSGDDEVFLNECTSLPHACRATALLSRCVGRTTGEQETPAEWVRNLSVGDREALFLHLHRITFGERMPCVLTCLDSSCAKKMDLDLAASELLVPPYESPVEIHEAPVDSEGESFTIRFRTPNGGDQEAAAPVASASPAAGAELILRRCVQGVSREPSGDPVSEIPSCAAVVLPSLMAELDPQAEILLDLVCPSCGGRFSALFDSADYFFSEISGRSRELYTQVYLLASNYHWSEREILQMPRRKRLRYLEILEENRAS